ncbi:sensor histidine kinase [Desertivirga xinjiangensis]|uniref:sensor histidine kinase n=1 Tax=Desertivirga xinjiangensis TaxID=539206 RepID=UPI00210C7738|nr:sensor histidine kinase [Pedobacter xinjiangensis]
MQPVLLGGAYVFAFSLIRAYFRQKKLQTIIQKQQFQNEIDALQAQINPHFLFNSLNYLFSSALLEKAESTAEGISTLSEMMRHTVQEARETFVDLDSEIRFIENYLKLFLDRMPKSIQDKIIISINVGHNQLKIPPLLIIPLIENAFKYGISIENPMPLEINIELKEKNLKMIVSNYIVNSTSNVEGTKTGSWNSQQRLKLLYPNTHRLQHHISHQRFEVELDMILN